MVSWYACEQVEIQLVKVEVLELVLATLPVTPYEGFPSLQSSKKVEEVDATERW